MFKMATLFSNSGTIYSEATRAKLYNVYRHTKCMYNKHYIANRTKEMIKTKQKNELKMTN